MDICDPARIKKAVARHGERFLRHIFTQGEMDRCSRMADPNPSYAARFAAKEAVMKVLGKGIGKVSFTEIDISADEEGRPVVTLSGKAEKIALELGIASLDVSLSHEKGMAVAFAAGIVGG